MTDKLTNHEAANIFAMYLGCAVVTNREKPLKGKITLKLLGDPGIPIDILRILLTPLSAITDEHAIEVYKMFGGINKPQINRENFPAIWIESEKDEYFICIDEFGKIEVEGTSNNDFSVLQQLILWGYAVPLFFGIDHWANGKTALELGVGIKKEL